MSNKGKPRSLRGFIMNEKQQGMTKERIVLSLTDRGYDEETAKAIVAHYWTWLNEPVKKNKYDIH